MSFNKLQFCFSFYLLLYCQLLPSRIHRSLIHGHNNQRFPNSLTFPWTRVICLTRSNHVVKGVINSQFFMKMTQLKQFEWFPIPINFLQTFSKEMKPAWCEIRFPKRFAPADCHESYCIYNSQNSSQSIYLPATRSTSAVRIPSVWQMQCQCNTTHNKSLCLSNTAEVDIFWWSS